MEPEYTPEQYREAARRAFEAGNIAAAEELAQAGIAAQRVAQPEQSVGAAEDVGRGFLGGLTRGVEGMFDLAGSAFYAPQEAVYRGVQAVGQRILGEDAPDWMQSPEPMTPQDQRVQPGFSDISAFSRAMGYEPQTRAGEYAQTAGETALGALLTPGGPVARLAYGVLAPTVGAEAGSAIAEATGMGPTGEAIARTAGAVLTPGLLAGASRLVSPTGGVDPVRLERARLLASQGVPDITAGQQAGREGLQIVEDAVTASPEQLRGFRDAAIRAFGGTPQDDIGRVLTAERARIGGEFDDVVRGLTIDPTATSPAGAPSIVTRLQQIADDYVATSPVTAEVPAIRGVQQLIDDALSGATTLGADDVARMRSRLGRIMRTSTDPGTVQAAGAMQREIDDLIEASLALSGRTDDIARLQTARTQYRDFLAFERAATRAGEAGLEGNITPQALAQALRTQGATQYTTGGRDLFGDITRAGEQLLRPATAVPAGGLRYDPAVAAGQAAETAATVAGPGGGGLLAALAARAFQPLQRAAAQDPLGQMYLGNQLLSAPELLPLSGRALAYGPLASMGATQD